MTGPGPSASLSWEMLERLAARHGEGFWLLDPDVVRRNVEAFRGAFVAAGWPDTILAWSYKTSWLPPVVRAAQAAGAWSEVVSRHELELALAIGADPSSMIVNGPLWTRDDLERACVLGCLVNLDNQDEVADLIALARSRSDRRLRIGLRANVDIGQGDRGRFGLDAEAGELQSAARALRAEPNISVCALHLHISGARQAEAYARRAARLVRLAGEVWPDGDGPQILNIGGGFAGAMPQALAVQLGGPSPAPAEYAAAIVPALLERWPNGGPRLVLEPGMALAADTMRFAGRVGATKSIAGISHAIVGASVYTVKPTLHTFDMPFEVVRADAATPPPGRMVVSGWTCMESDVLSRDCRFALRRGDWLIFDNCGAYTFGLNPRFIRGTPAVLSRGADGAWSVCRPEDDVRSWLAPFQHFSPDHP